MALLPLKSPTTVGVFGATQAGKSTFIRKMLEQAKDMFTTPPKWILYCYGVKPEAEHEMENEIPGLTLHEGLPTEEIIEEKTFNKEHGIIVLDDLIAEVVASPKAESLFIMGSHHRNMTVILVSQNLYYQGRNARTINLNLHYLVLCRNLRDKSQIRYLAQQAFPGQVKDFMRVYDDVHKTPFNYLLIDLHPHTDDEYRLRTRIFRGELPIIYQLD
jgi:hypothetical protein